MSPQIRFNYIIVLTIVTGYFFGFYFNEDSAGGGKIDLFEHEWGNFLLFRNAPLAETLISLDYESSRTPLFLIIHKYNFLIKEIDDLRLVTFCFGIFTFLFFYICLKNIFKDKDKSLILLVSSLILLSPYFRSSVFWANQEHLSIFFCILSLIFFYSSIEIESKKNKTFKYYTFTVVSSIFCFLSFYSDQKFFFLAPIIYFYFIKNNSIKFFLIYSFINFLLFLPAIYLFYIWEGIVPVESQFRLIYSPSNINIFISNIGIYFIPFFLILFYKNKFKPILINIKELFLITIIGVILIFLLPTNPSTEGSGIVFKLLSTIYLKEYFLLEWKIFKIIYLIINIFFIYIILIFLKITIKNLFIILSFALIFQLTYFTYQSYVDPIFLIMIYSLFDMKNINLMNSKVIHFNLVFYAFILISSIIFRAYVI